MAAYFAVSCRDSRKAVRVYALDRNKASVLPDAALSATATMEQLVALAQSALVEAPTLTARIGAQRGLFTFHGRPDYRLSDGATPAFLKEALKFQVEPGHRDFFRQRLYQMGIDQLQLMADIDGMCSSLGWWYHSGLRSPGLSGAAVPLKDR